MDDDFDASEINSPEYWNKRFFEDWIAKGGRKQTAFFAELCCRELPDWLVEEVRARKSGIFDYGCALGDALPVLQRAFPDLPIRGGDIAQVGLGMARALHPGFEFVDVAAIGEASKIADIVYCSNTLEHFENWREILHRLSRQAREYVLVMVPFEEEDRIDEHLFTFEFDSLPVRLSSGACLLHLAVCDAGLEPQTQWNGLQLIALYGKQRRSRAPASAEAIPQPSVGSLVFDLRGAEPTAIPSLLAGLAAMSHTRRQIARELGEARKVAQIEAAARSEAAGRLDALKADRAALEAVLRAYAELTRGTEDAQRRLLEGLTALNPDLIGNRHMSPIAEGWQENHPNDVAAHQATLARLFAALDRANRLGLAFHERATGWQAERDALSRRLQRARRMMEAAIGERDRAHSRILALEETATPDRSRPSPARVATARSGPLVSIILPVYDQAYLVDEAIAGNRFADL